VFLSWSGERSRLVAMGLRDSLHKIFNSDETDKKLAAWMSDIDIHAGQRFREVLEPELKGAELAILCLTPECADKPWIFFEAGVISAGKTDTSAIPFLLFGLDLEALPNPFGQFNAVMDGEAGTLKLLQTVNALMPTEARQTEKDLKEGFTREWPVLSGKLKSAEHAASPPWHRLFVSARPQRAYDEDLKKASEIWLAGVSLEDTLTTYTKELQDQLNKRCKLRVLLAKSEDSILEPAVLRKAKGETIKVRIKQKQAEIELSKATLVDIIRGTQQVIDRESVQIKETRYPLAYGVHAMDPNTPHGTLYVKFYPYRIESKPKPHIVLHANRDHAYRYFWQELNALFADADDIDLLP
jgi:hypothetical protein